MDLIRFNKFTTGYNWAFKGNAVEGIDVDEHYKLYPIPASEVLLNTNLKRNPGY